jgi:hypothetical protein
MSRDALAVGFQVTLVREAEVSFVPTRVFFLIAPETGNGELLRRVSGVFQSFDETVSPRGGRYLFATSIAGSSERVPPSFAVVVVGEGSHLLYIPPQESVGKGGELKATRDITVLEGRLKSVQVEIDELQQVRKEQNSEIKRLKGDATVIARLGRVDALQARIEQLQLRVAGIEADISYLKNFLRLAKKQSEPRNFARRERELVKQLKLLADASRDIEASERSRREASQGELQQQLRMIEATRSISEEQLLERLRVIREKRMKIEEKLGVSSSTMSSPDEYLQ